MKNVFPRLNRPVPRVVSSWAPARVVGAPFVASGISGIVLLDLDQVLRTELTQLLALPGQFV